MEIPVDSISEVRLSHDAFGLETQPQHQLDGSLVVFGQRDSHPPQPRTASKICHRRPNDRLAAPQSTIEHYKVHVCIELDSDLCRSRKANDLVPLHKLIELVRGSHHTIAECFEGSRNHVIKHLRVLPHSLPQVLQLAGCQHQWAERQRGLLRLVDRLRKIHLLEHISHCKRVGSETTRLFPSGT